MCQCTFATAGVSLNFMTDMFKAWLARCSIEAFVTTMRKSGVEDRLVCSSGASVLLLLLLPSVHAAGEGAFSFISLRWK